MQSSIYAPRLRKAMSFAVRWSVLVDSYIIILKGFIIACDCLRIRLQAHG